MNTRMRSPRYPGTPLEQAIDYVVKIHKSERTNAVDREVAAQAMGYSGICGRSAKVLADLIQYGLLERGAKNEVRVSRRAVEILHPESLESKREALQAAAYEPELFRRIGERFAEGRPSEAALRSYFVREEFTDAAIPSAVRAYMETLDFMEHEIGSESHGPATIVSPESMSDQSIKETSTMTPASQTRFQSASPAIHDPIVMNLDWVNKRGWVNGYIASKADAQSLIDFANHVMGTLPDSSPEADTGEAEQSEPAGPPDEYERP